ncbi:MAG: hypothetical protein OXE81_06425 [Gammaproteobacteria bacterium]|nr:hypothetical protein [Gammaproteobacteria bacterium]MCY4277458.1 hypothetical protein [Gammaproteobacteria bacterium]
MTRERGPHPEFMAYAREMDRIKRIILKIGNEPMPQDPEDIGAQAQKIRRMLEIIVNACLLVQMAIDDGKRLRRFANKSRAEVLKDRVDGNHYPSIADEPSRLGRPVLIVAPEVHRGEYLTRERWFTVWHTCGTLVHEERPGSTRPKPRYDNYPKDSRVWLQWIINLLSLHRMVTKDLRYQALVSLHEARMKCALLSVAKRVTPWQTRIDREDGGSMALQVNVDGEWQDVKNPEQGAITLVKPVGHYTAQSYFPVDR